MVRSHFSVNKQLSHLCYFLLVTRLSFVKSVEDNFVTSWLGQFAQRQLSEFLGFRSRPPALCDGAGVFTLNPALLLLRLG